MSSTIKKPTRIGTKTQIVTIPAGADAQYVTATLNSGETFLGWLECASSGWTGHCYPGHPGNQTTTIYTSEGTSTSARDVECLILYSY